jgi:DNA repair protein RecO (recombination protein O)
MSRDFTFEALVLRRYPVGESHRSVTFLTKERGLLSALAHGAAKSQNRLKLLTTPIRHVRLKAYHDPVADSWKVTDLEPLNLLGGLGELLERSAAATVWTELLLASWESGGVFDLFAQAFALLDTADSATVARLEGQTLWRALEIAGLMPEFSRCSVCGKPLAGKPIWFSVIDGEPVCQSCRAGITSSGELSLPSVAIDSLLATLVLPLDEALASPVSAVAAAGLRTHGLKAWERALGRRLRSVVIDQSSGPAPY